MGRGGITYKIWVLFVEVTFHTKNDSKAQLLIPDVIDNWYLHPKSTMRLSVVVTIKDAKEKKHININIGVGSMMKSEVIYMRYNKREGRITGMSKYMAVCVQDVSGKKNFLVIFEYGKKREVGAP